MPWTHRAFWIGPLLIAAILALFSSAVARTKMRHIYAERFVETRRERLFLASFGFLTTVAVIRGITFAIHNDIGPFHDINMRGRHIHHLVWGILLLLLVGYGWLLRIGAGSEGSLTWAGRLLSMLYGVAAALTLDEFALWLNLRDVYWEREGRESFEALGLFGALLGLGIFGQPFFRGIWHELLRVTRRRTG
jgi:hypothetical protein